MTRKLISYLLISLFLFSLVMGLPEPPPTPTLSNGQSNTSYAGVSKNQSVEYSSNIKESKISFTYLYVGLLVGLLACLGLYYYIFKRKKSLNIKLKDKKI